MYYSHRLGVVSVSSQSPSDSLPPCAILFPGLLGLAHLPPGGDMLLDAVNASHQAAWLTDHLQFVGLGPRKYSYVADPYIAASGAIRRGNIPLVVGAVTSEMISPGGSLFAALDPDSGLYRYLRFMARVSITEQSIQSSLIAEGLQMAQEAEFSLLPNISVYTLHPPSAKIVHDVSFVPESTVGRYRVSDYHPTGFCNSVASVLLRALYAQKVSAPLSVTLQTVLGSRVPSLVGVSAQLSLFTAAARVLNQMLAGGQISMDQYLQARLITYSLSPDLDLVRLLPQLAYKVSTGCGLVVLNLEYKPQLELSALVFGGGAYTTNAVQVLAAL